MWRQRTGTCSTSTVASSSTSFQQGQALLKCPGHGYAGNRNATGHLVLTKGARNVPRRRIERDGIEGGLKSQLTEATTSSLCL